MRIDQLTVQNFRCFEELSLTLHPEFNVLIGENATGKTTVLQSLAIAAGCWFLKLVPFTPPRIDLQDVRRTFVDLGEEYQPRLHYPVRVSSAGSIFGKPHSWSRSRQDHKSTARRASGLEKLGLETAQLLNDDDAAESIILPVVAYYRASRLWQTADAETGLRRPMDQAGLSRLEGYRSALGKWVDPNELLRWLERQDRIAYQEKRQPILYRVVRDVMRNMIQDAVNVRYDSHMLNIIAEFKDGDVQPYNQLSDGQRNMLALAGDLAMRMARLNPQLGKNAASRTPGIVLIDELDLHLHPQWQRHVAADLRRVFPKVQFITTTHSPQILSEIEPECVTILRREGEAIRATKPAQSYGLDTNGVLKSLMGTEARPVAAQHKIDAIDDALEDGNWIRARALVEDLRIVLNGDDPETTRLDASTSMLETLANAMD